MASAAIAAIKRGARQIVPRRRFADSLLPSDVFIVTYPRSGTTWLRYLIAQALGIEAGQKVTFETFRDHVPDVNDTFFANEPVDEFRAPANARFFSVHAPYDRRFPKVVYVLRDPRDVLISYYHFRRLRERNYTGTLAEFIASDDHYPCRWDEHVAGWLLSGPRPNVCLVRYRELHDDAYAVLRRVMQFADIECSEIALRRAVEASTFDEMRKAEEAYRNTTFTNRDERFVRRGQPGGHVDELDPETLRTLEDKYGAVMRIVGYQPGPSPRSYETRGLQRSAGPWH
jgi:hypothetical protein